MSDDNRLDPLTEGFSLFQLMTLESNEEQGKVNYQALYDELTGLCEEFFRNPREVRMSQKFLKIVTVMRFFGIYPEERWKENQWRLSYVNLSEAKKERLMRSTSGEYVFWQPPAAKKGEKS